MQVFLMKCKDTRVFDEVYRYRCVCWGLKIQVCLIGFKDIGVFGGVYRYRCV